MSVYIILTFILVIPQLSKAQNTHRFLEDFLQNRNEYINVFDCHKKDWENYGFWSQNFGLNLSILKDSTTHQRRCNFRGAKFKIALIIEDERSFQHFDDFKFPWVDVHTKENIGSISRALEYCKISPEFVRVNSYEHLYQENDDFLFTATAPYMTKDLLKKISFVRIQGSPKVCYLIKRPPKSYVITIFTNAFDSSVWLAIIICLILLAICLYGILNIEGKREAIKFRDSFNAFDMALIALEAVCQQGASIDPRSYSARILEVLMFTAFMFLYVSYSANILVLLQSTTTIHSIDEMRELKFKIGGMNTSSMKHYHSGIGEDLYQRSINSSGAYSIQEGMERVREGLFAFYLESHYSYTYIKESYTDYETCGLQQVGESFETRLGFAGFNKRSPYAELFKVIFLKMEELGFQSRHFKRYFRKPVCYSPGSSFDTVGIPETYQAILVVTLGVVLAILLLLAEILAAKCAERKNQKKKLNVVFDFNDS
ncbi:PREDICTED: glutamate [NMDA] receptor subunit 1-like [Nicrophorus vespilloides]|uniref:Glutamate [NMDA] receptor subunit 1-like n=1 Tax=Nicrophorus vespilloides TaxID=110193 RepID=A0ABM1N754_NICVS|nr:PREDICTED: glutamate [NMDA] receptor subunit 1-like [Nicrophorus vespilloides]